MKHLTPEEYNDNTPEGLLKRALSALARAEENARLTRELVAVSNTAAAVGQFALDLQNSEPKNVVIDSLSQTWRDIIGELTNVRQRRDTMAVRVSVEEWETLLALRTGEATVHLAAEGP